MTTTSEAPPAATRPADRYAAAIVGLQRGMRFGNLAGTLDDLGGDVHIADHGHGVTTVVAPTAALPRRYLLGAAGFRLAEYLDLGYASAQVAARHAMFGEPIHAWAADDLHCLTLDSRTGQILGYVTLVGSARDGTFPVEHAHGLDMLAAAGVDVPRERVREIKRFVQLTSLDDRALRIRVSLGLLYGIAYMLRTTRPAIGALVGDVEPHVALRHMLVMGLRVKLVEGTTPTLPPVDLMHPMYQVRADVRPFVAETPDLLNDRCVALDTACRSDEPIRAFGQLIRALRTQVITVPHPGGERDRTAAVL